MAKLASSSTLALHFLRRLLCAPHSSSGANADDPAAAPEQDREPRSPCIVARLMGLDAMPAEAPHAHPTPLRRSRSASSAEGSSPGGRGPWDWDAPRQVVRSSASLREKPAYLRRESDEFLLLSFSPEDRGRDVQEELEFLLAAAAAERRPGGAGKQKRNGRRRKLRFGDDEAEESSSGSGRRLFRRRVPAAECDAQNSSPVSVLEARDAHDESSTTTTTSSSLEEVEHAEPCSASSDEAQTALDQQNSRRKLHADLDQFQSDYLSPARTSCHVSRCSDRERRNRRVLNKAEVITPDVAGIWQPICRLVEEDLKNMEWPTRDGAIAVAEIELGILDHVICEMMDELLMQGRTEAVRPVSLRSISKKQPGAKNDLQIRGAIGCY